MPRSPTHKWAFRPRFRKHAFGWRSQPATQRIKEAVSEIKQVARLEPILAAEGAVLFLEKVAPALEHVDGSSGAIGTALNRAIAELAELIAAAPADDPTRQKWLERLFKAHAEDEVPYIESLAEYWGELCASPGLASRWADELLETTRRAITSQKPREFFHGTTACLSALYAAGRFDELLDLLEEETFWHYKRWAVKSLATQGKRAEAIRLAESQRSSSPTWRPGRPARRASGSRRPRARSSSTRRSPWPGAAPARPRR